MYNICMKKISVLIVGALLLAGFIHEPAQCGFISNYKTRIEQTKMQKSTIQNIKNLIEKQDIYANKHDLKALKELYSPEFVNSIIINGQNGEVQTEDISIDAAEIWVTVDKDGKYDFSYVDPDKAAVEDITVHVQAPADWAEPHLWAWSAPDGTNVFSTWPGEALEEGENGWLTKTIPGWVNSIIVNGNEGSVQTSDISIETGKDVWLQVQDAENFTLSYEEPEGTATVEPTEETKTEVTQETAVAEENKETKSSAAPIAGAVVALAAVAGGCGYAVKKKNKNN